MILTCGDATYRLFYKAIGNTRHPILQRVWVTEDTPSDLSNTSFRAFAQCSLWNKDYCPESYSQALFCFDVSYIRVVHLNSTSEVVPVPKRVKAEGQPTRILYLRYSDKYVVALTNTVVVPPARNQERGKRRIFSRLRVIQDGDISQPIDGPQDNDSNDLIVGVSMERILGIMEWFVSVTDKVWPCVLVNTTRPQKKPRPNDGRVYVYRIITNSTGDIGLSLKTTLKLDEPVYAVTALGPHSIAIYCGSKIQVHGLSTREDGTLKWVLTNECDVRSPGRAISAHPSMDLVENLGRSSPETLASLKPFIYATSYRESLIVLKLVNGELEPCFYEQRARGGLSHHLVARHSIILTANLDGVVAGLRQPSHARLDNALDTAFEIQLPQTIIKFQPAPSRALKIRGRNTEEQPIIGCTMDGVFYQFDLLPEAQWRLLRFVQNLAERDERIWPLTWKDHRKKHIEPNSASKSNMHVDGDVLGRLVDYESPDGEPLLAALLQKPPDQRFVHYDYEAGERRRRFVELAKAALGEMRDEDVISEVVRMIMGMLEPAM